jgi:flavin reductase (DIM6/NTAB) family NADH-FMN oxidoreductase RutF
MGNTLTSHSQEAPMPVNQDTFKQVMSRFAAGVTVVTTLHGEVPIGVTATAFSSLSIEPPLVLVCIAKGLFTHETITASEVFAVNFLTNEQLHWGKLFAGMLPDTEDRFAEVEWFTKETGAPLLPGVLAWVDCSLHTTYDGGDHSIFVGQVEAAHASDGQPLAYFNRGWVSIDVLHS